MKKAIIVDSDKVARSEMSKMLATIGIAGILSSTGKHAWETIYYNDDIALVVIERALPDMKGDRLLTFIRSDPFHMDLPVIMTSPAFSSFDVAMLRDISPRKMELASKPLHRETFLKQVEAVLDPGNLFLSSGERVFQGSMAFDKND